MILLALYALLVTAVAVGTSWLAYTCVRKNLQLEDQRERLVDQIEESLDMLDSCFQGISRAADIPVLTDEPVIREVLGDIKRAKNTVLAIASLVVTYGTDEDDDTGDEEDA